MDHVDVIYTDLGTQNLLQYLNINPNNHRRMVRQSHMLFIYTFCYFWANWHQLIVPGSRVTTKNECIYIFLDCDVACTFSLLQWNWLSMLWACLMRVELGSCSSSLTNLLSWSLRSLCCTVIGLKFLSLVLILLRLRAVCPPFSSFAYKLWQLLMVQIEPVAIRAVIIW